MRPGVCIIAAFSLFDATECACADQLILCACSHRARYIKLSTTRNSAALSMERLLNTPMWKREEHCYQPASSQHIISRATALSRYDRHRQLSYEKPVMLLNEKDALRGLNERFAGFIEKVRHLESQNRALEKEREDVRLKAKTSSCLAKQFEAELQELRRRAHEMSMQKHRIEIEQQHLEDEFNTYREKCEAEIRSRTEAEESISVLKSYIDNASLIKQDMDRKTKALMDEIESLKKNHLADVTEMLSQIQEPRVSAGRDSFGRSELTAALRNIRTQLEGRAVCPVSHTEQRISSQLAKLTKVAEADREALIASKAQISQYRRQLLNKRVELDSVKGMREALEKQIYDLEQRHTAEIHRYQDAIRELENELKNTKHDMSSHVQEYQDLLNVKMALDAEIYSYRQLLEGEESRYSTLSGVHISVPYVYRQSPIYTLPSVTRVGGVTRKAEPQYKFVEEIITETTREDIEISDTGSDDGEVAGEGDKKQSEAHSEKKETQESATEKQYDPHAEHKVTENKYKPTKKSTAISVVLNESDWDSEPAQCTVTVPEYNEEKDTGSKTQEPDKETKLTADIDVKNEVTEKGEHDKAKALDKENIKQLNTTEQKPISKSNQQLKDPDLPSLKGPELRQKPKEEFTQHVENETQLTVMPKDASTGTTAKKNTATCELKSVEEDTSTADAGQETRAKKDNEAKAKSVENSKADVQDSKKADDIKNSAKEVESECKAKTQAVDVQKEALPQSKEKETKSEEQSEKNVDSKPEVATGAIKPEKEENGTAREGQKAQVD